MSRRRCIAAAQTVPVRGDVAANLEQHVRLVRIAAEEEPDVLVFPELSLTGYEPDLADSLAFSEDDPRLAPLVALATAHRMTLVVGAPVRLRTGLHIGAFLLAPGAPTGLYTKRRLGAFTADDNPGGPIPLPEGAVFRSGDRDPLVRLSGCSAAVAICADIGAEEHPARAAARGAEAYLASMFLIPSDLTKESAVLAGYAAKHSMAVVLANFGGPSGGFPSGGGSAIWSERGALLTRLAPSGAGIAIARRTDEHWTARAIPLDRA